MTSRGWVGCSEDVKYAGETADTLHSINVNVVPLGGGVSGFVEGVGLDDRLRVMRTRPSRSAL